MTYSPEIWFEYFKFSLRYGMYIKGEECLVKILKSENSSNVYKDKLDIYAALLMQRNQLRLVKKILANLLSKDW